MNFGRRRLKQGRAQLKSADPLSMKTAKGERIRERSIKGLIVLAAAVATSAVVHGLGPAFTYRIGQRPGREIRVRVPEFSRRNQIKTNALRLAAANAVKPILQNDPTPIAGLSNRLHDLVLAVGKASRFEDLPEAVRTSWPIDRKVFDVLKEASDTPNRRDDLHRRIDAAFAPLVRDGVLGPSALPQQEDSSVELDIRQATDHVGKASRRVSRQRVETLRIANPDEPTGKEFIAAFASPDMGRTMLALVADKLVASPTLTYLDLATTAAREQARAAVGDVFDSYRRGEILVDQGQEITEEQLVLLDLEHKTAVGMQSTAEKLRRGVGVFLLVSAMFALVGYAVLKQETRIIRGTRRIAMLCTLVVASLLLARLIAREQWDAELVPVGIAGMLAAIAYSPRFALVITFALSLLTSLALGSGIGGFLVLMGGTAAGVLALNEVRTRTKLIKVGAIAGLGYLVLTWAVGLTENQPLPLVASTSLWRGGWGLMTGFFLGGSLPFIESAFGIVTGISLLELGDITHPLLQELVRRAPGTHNHSVTVATIAEAATEKIGGNALLVRIGSYFHDIGKMLKPHYFVENQAGAMNRHANLAPAMSTLIIIGHVKDGADLARQHHLPEPIIDLIEQHHGTTLVEYFYHEASRRFQDQADSAPILESAFRYPGPKPKTKEAAVLMMSDAVESAGRTLDEPTPARIENLVRELIEKRLRDGQFDDCGMTLREIGLVRESLIKSLIGIYHGRVKYPEQRTA